MTVNTTDAPVHTTGEATVNNAGTTAAPVAAPVVTTAQSVTQTATNAVTGPTNTVEQDTEPGPQTVQSTVASVPEAQTVVTTVAPIYNAPWESVAAIGESAQQSLPSISTNLPSVTPAYGTPVFAGGVPMSAPYFYAPAYGPTVPASTIKPTFTILAAA